MKNLAIVAALSLLFCACSSTIKRPADTVAFDDVLVVDNPERVFAVNGAVNVEVPCIGTLEFRIIDSLMFVSTSERTNAWKIYSLPSMTLKAEFATQGSGPEEFTQIPLVRTASFTHRGGALYATVADNVRQQVFEIDIPATIDSASMVASVKKEPRLSRFTVSSRYMSGDTLLTLNINPAENRVERVLYVGDREIASQVLAELNSFKAESIEKLGVLMPNILTNTEKGVCVEINEMFPQINSYSPASDKGATWAVGSDIRTITSVGLSDEKARVYGWANGYDDFFVVREMQGDSASLLFMSWEGKPLLEVTMPDGEWSCFDIDLENKHLYTYDFAKEQMKRYDISALLSEI